MGTSDLYSQSVRSTGNNLDLQLASEIRGGRLCNFQSLAS